MQNKCKKCMYSRKLTSSYGHYCGYLEITGHKRPVKANECELHKQKKNKKEI